MTNPSPTYPAPIPARGPIRVLFSCIGRRVQLLEAFRAAAKRLGRPIETWATDQTWLAPGMQCVDHAAVLPAIDAPGYVAALAALVKRRRIHFLLPLIDSELLALARARDRFAALGCTIAISSPRVVATCRDKVLTYHHLRAAGLPTPTTWSLEESLRLAARRFPLYVKPRAGSAARGHFIVHDRAMLRALAPLVVDPIAQELIVGDEFTLDAYCGFDSKVRCVIPRRRIEVRSGEVSKGVTVADRAIIDLGRRVVESLGECVGVVTIQCIRGPDRRLRVIEINPRVGGGLPLAIKAGADIPHWMLATLCGKPPAIRANAFSSGLYMLRYDEAVYCDRLPAAPARRKPPKR